MLKVYVAGPYSADNVITVLENIRAGIKMAKDVFIAGFAPFCPWLDYHYTLALADGEKLTVEQYYAYSMAWLRASDAVLILPGWENSNGTKAEMREAVELGIPVFHDITELLLWRTELEGR